MSGGVVHQINRKVETRGQHGLPKQPVPDAELTSSGLQGDFNRYRHEERSDDPEMAVLLLPLETIQGLDREGWPVRPGDLGENITTEGVEYEEFWPGRRFRIGEAVVEVSKACTPCDNLYELPYVGRLRGPEFVKTTLGRRGWFARVVHPGHVRTGDSIAPTT